MPKPVRTRTWRPPLPSARRWPRRRRSSTPGCSSWTRNHPQPAAVLPESAARKVSPATGQPGIRGLRIGLPARQWRLRDACGLSRLNDFLALWSQAHMRLVTGRSHRPRSAWPNQARLVFFAVTHRYERINCLWLEPFQIAELARPVSSVVIDVGARRSACSAIERFAPRECGRDLPWVKLGIEALMWGMQAVAGKPRSSSGSSNADHAIRSRG